MTLGGPAIGAGPELTSFGLQLKHHLTELELCIETGKGEPRHLETLGMFTALKVLKFGHDLPEGKPISYCNLSGERIAMKLKHLVCLKLWGFKGGEVVLSCPKLAEVHALYMRNVSIWVEGDGLTILKLIRCIGFRVAMASPEEQLQNLRDLVVCNCAEVGKLLIEYASQVTGLEKLEYRPFPAACMPATFQQSLQTLYLHPEDWSHNLPAGLNGLHELKEIRFDSFCNHWDIVRPLPELLPMDSPKLESITVGCHSYFRTGPGHGPKEPFKYEYNPEREGFPRRLVKL